MPPTRGCRVTLEPLAWEDMQLGSDPDLLRRELLLQIRQRIQGHPRSAQRAVGPSELGTPCLRRLGFRLAETMSTDAAKQSPPSWRPTVGTAVHTWLAETFDEDNETATAGNDPRRWAVERRVMVGTIGGQEVWGSADLYDRVTATVVDWKVVGTTTLRKARTVGPTGTYRTQAHLYGRGFRNAGLPVERVAIMFLPSSGELSEAVWWSEPYAETIATQALSRAEGLLAALTAAGRDVVIPVLSTADNFCTGCPWWSPGTMYLSHECPGHESIARQQIASTS